MESQTTPVPARDFDILDTSYKSRRALPLPGALRVLLALGAAAGFIAALISFFNQLIFFTVR